MPLSSREPSVGPLGRTGTASSSSSNASSLKSTQASITDAAAFTKLKERAELYKSAMKTIKGKIETEAGEYIYRRTISEADQKVFKIESVKDATTGKWAAWVNTMPATILGEHIDRSTIAEAKGYATEFDARFEVYEQLKRKNDNK